MIINRKQVYKKAQYFRNQIFPWLLIIVLVVVAIRSFLVNFGWWEGSTLPDWIASFLLFIACFFLLEIHSIRQKLLKSNVELFEKENSDYRNSLGEFLKSKNPGKVDLFEFSASSIHQWLIEELVANGAKIRLLVCCPEKAPNDYQRKRIEISIVALKDLREKHQNSNDFQIRKYKVPASIRGRKFGHKLISMSWYTYGIHSDEEVLDRGPHEISGHINPILNSTLLSESGVILEGLFDRVFEDVWENSDKI